MAPYTLCATVEWASKLGPQFTTSLIPFLAQKGSLSAKRTRKRRRKYANFLVKCCVHSQVNLFRHPQLFFANHTCAQCESKRATKQNNRGLFQNVVLHTVHVRCVCNMSMCVSAYAYREGGRRRLDRTVGVKPTPPLQKRSWAKREREGECSAFSPPPLLSFPVGGALLSWVRSFAGLRSLASYNTTTVRWAPLHYATTHCNVTHANQF